MTAVVMQKVAAEGDRVLAPSRAEEHSAGFVDYQAEQDCGGDSHDRKSGVNSNGAERPLWTCNLF